MYSGEFCNSPSASKWSNVLQLAELLVSSPASNGKLERLLSILNVIKTEKKVITV